MRVALYARVSTNEQVIHGLSIEAQLSALRAFSENMTVVGEFVDEGVSARVPASKRPQLMALLSQVEKARVDTILFTRLDRWTRNIREYYKVQDVLDSHNVAWRALQEDYETETAAGRLKVNIMLAVAQDEADRTSERIKAVFDEKRRKGLALNGHTPIGIDYNNGILTANADAEKVRAVFRRYIATRSVRDIALHSEELIGKHYTATGMKAMIDNERYVLAGVIDRETWEKAQQIRSVRATRSGRSDRVYLFSGLLFCPKCGGRLTVHAYTVKGVEYVYYWCGRRAKDHSCDCKVSVREDVVEAYLVKHILSSVAGFNVRVAKKQKKTVNPASIQKKLDKLTDLYLNDEIEKEDFDRRAAPLRDQLKAARIEAKAVNEEEIASVLDVYSTLSKAAQKAFWSALIKSIIPTEKGFNIALILP